MFIRDLFSLRFVFSIRFPSTTLPVSFSPFHKSLEYFLIPGNLTCLCRPPLRCHCHYLTLLYLSTFDFRRCDSIDGFHATHTGQGSATQYNGHASRPHRLNRVDVSECSNESAFEDHLDRVTTHRQLSILFSHCRPYLVAWSCARRRYFFIILHCSCIVHIDGKDPAGIFFRTIPRSHYDEAKSVYAISGRFSAIEKIYTLLCWTV